MSSNINQKEKAIKLRKEGVSYNNIIKILGIKSKGTLNAWFKNLKLSKKSIKLLEKNNKLAHERGLFKANKNRNEKIIIENGLVFTEAFKQIPELFKKDLILIGAALYWAEGMKSQTRTSSALIFSNSDQYMIKIYMRFIREILKTPELKIRAGIHIYPSISPDEAKKFWSNITGLPFDRFYIVNQISKASKRKRPVNKLPHGTLNIRVNDRLHFNKVMGMIEGIIKNLT